MPYTRTYEVGNGALTVTVSDNDGTPLERIRYTRERFEADRASLPQEVIDTYEGRQTPKAAPPKATARKRTAANKPSTAPKGR